MKRTPGLLKRREYRAKQPKIPKDLLKEYENSHQFKGWTEIRKLVQSGAKRELDSPKCTLKKTLKDYMFIIVSDYTNNSYIFKMPGISIEKLYLWIKDRKLDQTMILHYENGWTEFSMPYLYELSIFNHIQMKDIKEDLKGLIDGENEGISAFEKELYRYIKCLSKRKTDFITKIKDEKQDSKNEKIGKTQISDLHSSNENDNSDQEEDFEFGTQDDELNTEPIFAFKLPMKYLSREMVEEYKCNHPFEKWDEITEVMENYREGTLDVNKYQLMRALKNNWFIEPSDYTAPVNIIWYKIQQNIELETYWSSFAMIFNDQLMINIPYLFLQTKEVKTKVKQWLDYGISNNQIQPIDSKSFPVAEHKIKSLLTLYLKRLSKRKNDFITLICQKAFAQLQHQEDYANNQAASPEFQECQPEIFYYIVQQFIFIPASSAQLED